MTRPKPMAEENIQRIREEAMDFANVGIYRYTLDGTIVFMDRGTLRLLDLQDQYENPEELVGTDIGTLFKHVRAPGSLRKTVMEQGRVRQYEYRYQTLSGKDRWVYHNSYRITDPDTGTDMIQVIAQDITELKQAVRALESSEERYRALAEQSIQGIMVLSFSGKILFANRALAEITASPVEEMLTLGIDAVFAGIHPDDRPRVMANFARRAAGEPVASEYEIRLVRSDGTVKWASVFVATIVLKNQKAAQITITDITERKDREKREKERETRLLHAQKLESLGVLAGGIAHDFNNLLAAIMANGDMARARLSDPTRVADHLDRLSDAAGQAARLCQQLLAYAGRGQLSLRNLDLNELVTRSVDLIGITLAGKGTVQMALTEDLPPVKGDPTQLQQIILNLISNAADALPGGAGTIVVQTDSMSCDRAILDQMSNGAEISEGEYVRLSVEDNGMGMDAATAAQIFDPFFTTKFTGRGLGLASVLGILKGHKGAIGVRSEPGKGTCFTVVLPAMMGARVLRELESEAEGRWRGTGVVLIADDESFVLEALERALTDFGFEVISTKDGQEAVEVFEQRGDSIDLVILDVTMPRLGGLAACRRVREIRPEVPVLFSSGYNEQDLSEELAKVNATGFLRKPYRIHHLEELLRKLV